MLYFRCWGKSQTSFILRCIWLMMSCSISRGKQSNLWYLTWDLSISSLQSMKRKTITVHDGKTFENASTNVARNASWMINQITVNAFSLCFGYSEGVKVDFHHKIFQGCVKVRNNLKGHKIYKLLRSIRRENKKSLATKKDVMIFWRTSSSTWIPGYVAVPRLVFPYLVCRLHQWVKTQHFFGIHQFLSCGLFLKSR